MIKNPNNSLKKTRTRIRIGTRPLSTQENEPGFFVKLIGKIAKKSWIFRVFILALLHDNRKSFVLFYFILAPILVNIIYYVKKYLQTLELHTIFCTIGKFFIQYSHFGWGFLMLFIMIGYVEFREYRYQKKENQKQKPQEKEKD